MGAGRLGASQKHTGGRPCSGKRKWGVAGRLSQNVSSSPRALCGSSSPNENETGEGNVVHHVESTDKKTLSKHKVQQYMSKTSFDWVRGTFP